MRGKVFKTSIDHYNIEPHPHLVVVLSGKQCLVVPAYTEGKFQIEKKIQSLKDGWGHREDQVCVRMDNSKYLINCVKGFVPHLAVWFTWQTYWADKTVYEAINPVCEMNPAGMDLISRGLLALHEIRPSVMADKQIAQVKQYLLPPS